jgi:hypothetical protein
LSFVTLRREVIPGLELIFSRSRSVTSRRNNEFSCWELSNWVPRFAPAMQGHNTHVKRARNFALPFPLRRQIVCSR